MEILTTGNCAVAEINGLSYHASAHEAMLEFCNQNFKPKGVRYTDCYADNNDLYCFYLFTAAICREGQMGMNDGPFGARKYGDEFSAFILDNKLGKVVETGVVRNRAFHSEHSNKAWLWEPNQKKLKDWWKVEKDKAGEKSEEPQIEDVGYLELDDPLDELFGEDD